jgi:hypothetical protein
MLSRIANSVKSSFTLSKNTIQNMDENFASSILFFMIIFLIILMIINFVYIGSLETRECSRMNKMYSDFPKLRSIDLTNSTYFGYTLKDYYIKTAYNACSGGNYKNDVVSICNLKDVIKQGVRGIDLEVYSLNDKPFVSTSTSDNYYVKETYNSVDFADVLSTLRMYAFSGSTCPNPNDPIILHLRIKSNNQNMFQNFAVLLKNFDDILLGKAYSYENHLTNLGNIKMNDPTIQRKIIIIVDRTNLAFMENKNFYEYVNLTSNSAFMRKLSYYDAKFTPDMNELIEYNKLNMTIILPDKGANPTNPSGLLTRQLGAQMVAMRYQLNEGFLKEYNDFFDNTGFAFALKPEKLRYVPVTIPDPPPPNPALSYAQRNVDGDFYKFNI